MSNDRLRRTGICAAFIVASATAYMVGTSASASPAPAVVVPITPCRLLDTRADNLVGLRNTPLGAGETATFTVWGTNGNCTIPTTANGIIANVTIVNPTAAGFLTLYPADATRPNASNLNWRAGDAPTPNLASVALSSTGTIKAYNLTGTVDVIIDITGYLLPTTSAAAGGRNRLTLDQIAQLRWDQDPGRVGEFALGALTDPHAVAFDGASIWITAHGVDKVYKMNPTTGSMVDYATQSGPEGITYDGTYIWVANSGSDSVSRIDPASGATAHFTVGDAPYGIAYDGTSIWVTNTVDGTVSKINPSTGAVAGPYSVGGGPRGIAYDGTSIWVANAGDDSLSKVNPTTGIVAATYPMPSGPWGIAYDGTSIWVANLGADSVSKVNPATGTRTHLTTGATSGPTGIAYDGTHLWITCAIGGSLIKLDPGNDAMTPVSMGGTPQGIVYDGTNIWVTNRSSDKVFKLLP